MAKLSQCTVYLHEISDNKAEGIVK